MRHSLTKLASVCLLVAWVGACAGPADRDLIPAGSLTQNAVRFQLAVYYLPRPQADPEWTLQRLLAAEGVTANVVG